MNLGKNWFLLILFFPVQVTLAHVSVAEFSKGEIQGWREKSFSGNTEYSLVKDENIQVLEGLSSSSASIFYKEISVDLNKTPVMNWSWKLTSDLKNNKDEQSKSGDDFGARIYVIYKHGFLPWNTIAINYVWASTQSVGNYWPSPYTDHDMMVALQTGDKYLNKWQIQWRNVKEDFKKFFNISVTEITGVAIMVDTDNMQQSAAARFGDIYFSED